MQSCNCVPFESKELVRLNMFSGSLAVAAFLMSFQASMAQGLQMAQTLQQAWSAVHCGCVSRSAS